MKAEEVRDFHVQGGANSLWRRGALALTAILGLYVGLWAEFSPHAFYG